MLSWYQEPVSEVIRVGPVESRAAFGLWISALGYRGIRNPPYRGFRNRGLVVTGTYYRGNGNRRYP